MFQLLRQPAVPGIVIFYLFDSFKDPRGNVYRNRFMDGIKLPGRNGSDALDFDRVTRDFDEPDF